jgi:hypothetical protein
MDRVQIMDGRRCGYCFDEAVGGMASAEQFVYEDASPSSAFASTFRS